MTIIQGLINSVGLDKNFRYKVKALFVYFNLVTSCEEFGSSYSKRGESKCILRTTLDNALKLKVIPNLSSLIVILFENKSLQCSVSSWGSVISKAVWYQKS